MTFLVDHHREKRLFAIFEYHDGGVGKPLLMRWATVFSYFSKRRVAPGLAGEVQLALEDPWWEEVARNP